MTSPTRPSPIADPPASTPMAAAPTSAGPGSVDWGQPRTKTTTWYDPMIGVGIGAGLSGLEFLRAVRDGRVAPPPIAVLLGMGFSEIEYGRVVFSCEPDESVYSPIGMVHGGLVCTLADSVVGCAVHSMLVAGVGYASIDLNVSYLRSVTAQSGVLQAVGRVTKPGRRVAFAEAEITDGAGQVVATATSSLLIIDRRTA